VPGRLQQVHDIPPVRCTEGVGLLDVRADFCLVHILEPFGWGGGGLPMPMIMRPPQHAYRNVCSYFLYT